MYIYGEREKYRQKQGYVNILYWFFVSGELCLIQWPWGLGVITAQLFSRTSVRKTKHERQALFYNFSKPSISVDMMKQG